ncbi:MAG: glutamine synthetase III [Mogibacterium sp.]|nr:glutamine synthetase III [Mogibacterium sp.]MBR2539251.1 glutamine synthetase III [Mogibacterium sp.]
MSTVSDYFGSMVFDDKVMRSMLSADVYRSMRKTINQGDPLNPDIANAVAQAMKNWAVSKGATHYTHWFQPLTGVTAEKHDSFIQGSPDGGVIMDFSGKELIKGEPDASSFPSGGLRATFEARGYTAWDPTSYAFIKGRTLCIPTAFCSYSGEALDEKTSLLRSMDALNKQALRVLRILGNDSVKRVHAVVGAEQEYFLVPRDLYEQRPDLRFTGRTLYGVMPPKGQELDDHYFGPIKPEISRFMEELNEELWKLGVLAKTEHNEVAPSQHELACIYTKVNVTIDQNQLVMEMIKKIAERHGFVALLHEKPFDGVNGSGKHNNWSLSTDKGGNLMSPGDTPHDNAQFLLFLCAVIRAVDEYQDLLRISVASASNDHRLGANEAPPAVISIFLGDELTAVLRSIEEDEPYEKSEDVMMKLGTVVLPRFSRDNTDRNRTSPFAFTGNKFEFRMPGSMSSLAFPNVIINSAVADSLELFADKLEGVSDPKEALYELVRETLRTHGRIIFNGNGYGDEWLEEAARRGLSNYRTTVDCVPHLLDGKNVEMLTRQGVFTRTELESRCEIMLETYCKTISIEARTMRSMAIKRIAPAVERYTAELAVNAAAKIAIVPGLACRFEEKTLTRLSDLTDMIYDDVQRLESILDSLESTDFLRDAEIIRDSLLPCMEELRAHSDAAEKNTSKRFWPLPNYGLLLFGEK